MTSIKQVTIFEDSGVVLMAYLLGQDDGTAIKQADVSTITYEVWDITSTPSRTTSETSLTVSSVIFDTLQTDARWKEGGVGYNFGWTAPATLFPDGSKTYRVEIKFTPPAGQPYHVAYDVITENLNRS